MAEERKHVQKSPLSHILSLPSASKKRTFSEKRIDKPEVKPDVDTVPQSAPPSSVPAASTVSGTNTAAEAPKAENDVSVSSPIPPKSENGPSNHSIDQPAQTLARDTGDTAPQETLGENSLPAETRHDGEGAGSSTVDQSVANDDVSDTKAEAEEDTADPKEQPETSTQEPPVKKLKIDSSKVIESVAGFKRCVSDMVVYEPGKSILDGLEDHLNSIVWVRIARKHISRSNPGVMRRKLWGADVYTDDSDIVAALYHTGHLDPENENEQIRELATGSSDLLVGILMLPKLLKYTGCYLNELNSRSWGSHHDGASFRIDTVKKLPSESAEFPARETVDRALGWSSSYLLHKGRESLQF